MKSISRVLVISASLCGWTAAETIRFDIDRPGETAAGWRVAMTHAGGAPAWSVVRDEGAPSPPHVFAQLSTDPTSPRYPLAILDGFEAVDGALRVKFKTVAGKVDQAAGMVWRYRDPDNYYVVRANALENNVVLYKVENGRRTALAPKGAPAGAYGVKHPVPSGTWSELSVEFRGRLFTVSFNGRKLFEAEDSTFPQGGKAGLWTKADSVTHFDDFSYEKRQRR